MEISNEELIKIIETTVDRCCKRHECFFNENERAMVHASHEAMVEEKANHGTIRVLFQWGVNLTDVTKQVRKWVLLALGGILLVIGYNMFVK